MLVVQFTISEFIHTTSVKMTYAYTAESAELSSNLSFDLGGSTHGKSPKRYLSGGKWRWALAVLIALGCSLIVGLTVYACKSDHKSPTGSTEGKFATDSRIVRSLLN